jgi:hypothetical protein
LRRLRPAFVRCAAQKRETSVFNALLAKVFGTSNERAVKRMLPTLEQINSHEPALKQLSDEQLAAKTVEFRARIAAAIEGVTDPEEILAAEKRALDASSPRPSPLSARLASAPSACVTSTSR